MSDAQPLLREGGGGINGPSGEAAPRDHKSRVYLSLVLLGMGSLFGWNLFINAVVYFQSRLTGTKWHDCIENYITFSFQAFNFTFQMIFAYWPVNVAAPMFWVNLLVFIFCTGLVFVTSIGGNTFFVSTILSAMLLGLACAGISAGVSRQPIGQYPPQLSTIMLSCDHDRTAGDRWPPGVGLRDRRHTAADKHPGHHGWARPWWCGGRAGLHLLLFPQNRPRHG